MFCLTSITNAPISSGISKINVITATTTIRFACCDLRKNITPASPSKIAADT